MRSNFHLTGFTPQLWTPLEVTAANQTANARKDRSLLLFARLKPGVTIEQARAEFSALARRAEQEFPEIEKGWGAAVRTFPDFLLYNFGIRNGLVVVMTTVGFVLLIACTNVAGLLLARAAGRRKELAIRLALGAGGLRITRQLLTENLLIALCGGALGLLLAYWGIASLALLSTPGPACRARCRSCRRTRCDNRCSRARDHWLMSNRSAGNERRAFRSSDANTLARDPWRFRNGRWFNRSSSSRIARFTSSSRKNF
jgi:hypothetical protein